MSTFKIKTITINYLTSQIRVTRSLSFKEKDSCCHYIPDEIESNDNVELIDSVEEGSSLLFPIGSKFPQDLHSHLNEKFKFEIKKGNVIGKLLKVIDEKKSIIVQGYKESLLFPQSLPIVPLPTTSPVNSNTGNTSSTTTTATTSTSMTTTIPALQTMILNQDTITEYIPLLQNTDNLLDYNLNTKLLKIIINNRTTSREIEISYNLKSTGPQQIGYFTHSIKGINSKELYTNPNLESNIPITFKTEYNWIPIWDIHSNSEDDEIVAGDHDYHSNFKSGVTLNIITMVIPEKQTYTINNLTCHRNYLNKIKINQIQTKCSRAVLVHPSSSIEISLYFENNSNLLLTKSPIIFVDDVFDNDLAIIKESIPTTSKPFLIPPIFNKPKETSIKLLKSVQPKSIGVILISVPNENIQVYKEISHSPLYLTKSKEFNITDIKTSYISTIFNEQTLIKMKYQFINESKYPTHYIVYLDDEEGVSINCKSGNGICGGEKIAESLYLFDSAPFTTYNFEILYSSCKQLKSYCNLPQSLINYLNDIGISIKYTPNKFETYDLSKLDRVSQNIVFRLISTIPLEKNKETNYFEKGLQNNDGLLKNILDNGISYDLDFNPSSDQMNTNQSTSLLDGSKEYNDVGLFGSTPIEKTPLSQFGTGYPWKQTEVDSALFDSITAMPQYRDRSFEELRYEDITYRKNLVYIPVSSRALFGTTPINITQTTNQPQSPDSNRPLVGDAKSSSTKNIEGTTPHQTISTGLFDQPTTTNGSSQPSTTTALFSQTKPFNLFRQPIENGGLFGSTQPSTTTGGLFGNLTNNSLFNQPSTPNQPNTSIDVPFKSSTDPPNSK